jgi:uncharacterized protein YbaP (TraB family)
VSNLKYVRRVGDLDVIERLSSENSRQKAPDVYFRLVDKINNQWLPKIEAMVKSLSTEFILVGALHLIGEEGLINRLSGKGSIAESLSFESYL